MSPQFTLHSNLFTFLFSVFLALTSEKEYDLAELSCIDTEEAKEYLKEHTLSLLKKIREHLSTIGMEAAALPEDEAQKYLLAVSVCFLYSKLQLYCIFQILYAFLFYSTHSLCCFRP